MSAFCKQWLRTAFGTLAVFVCLAAVHGDAHATRTMNSITANSVALTGSNSITVLPGGTVSVAVNISTSGGGDDDNWQSTGVVIATSAPTSYTATCSNSPNLNNDGTATVTYSATAPTTEGTYNLYVRAFSADGCAATNNTTWTYAGAIVVAAPPTVSSVVQASANPADTNSLVSWTVTFSKAVTGVDTSDFSLTATYGVSGASITSVTPVSSSVYTVTANTGSGNGGGDLSLNVLNNGTIVDSGNRALSGTGTGPAYMISPPCTAPPDAPAGLNCVCENFAATTRLTTSTINNASWIVSRSDSTGIDPNITNLGYLRLTNNTQNNAKAATVPGIFPAAGNYISAEFRLFAYSSQSGATGADGMGVTLSDYTKTPKPGAFGGSLGYAQKTGIDGFVGGWIGVGLDEWGNYQNPTEGRDTATGPGFRAQSVAVRGSGIYTAATNTWQTGYRWLAGTGANISPAIDNTSTASPAPGHRYRVIVDARNAAAAPKTTYVAVDRDTGSGTYTNLVPSFDAFTASGVNAASPSGYNQANVPGHWWLSFTGSTGSAYNYHEIGSLRICAQTILPPSGGTASGFNAIDEAYGTSPSLQDFQTGHIYMKLVNTPFKLDVGVLYNNQILTTYGIGATRIVTVKLVPQGNPTDADYCAPGSSCSSACKAKTGIADGTQTLSFPAGNTYAGKLQTANFTLNTAYKNLIAVISDDASPSVSTCSTDVFSVRPQSLQSTTFTTDVYKAGNPFAISVQSSGVTGSPSGYTGVPKVNNAALTVPVGQVPGTVSGVFDAADGGTPLATATGSSFSYSEVGSFILPGYDPAVAATATSQRGIYDGAYASEATAACDLDCVKLSTWTGVDSVSTRSDCIDDSYTNTKDASGKYGCLFGTTGSTTFSRFTPHHIALIDSVLTPACAATGFTYMNQPFARLMFQLEAQNSTNGKTQNYTGTLATAANPIVMVVVEDGNNGTDLSSRMDGVPAGTWTNGVYVPSGTWTDGVYSVDTDAAMFKRAAAPDGPYDSLQLGVKFSDGDSVAIGSANMNSATSGTCTTPTGTPAATDCDSRRLNDAAGVAQPTIVRFGRLRLMNAHGSDKLNLPIPMTAQYWNGTMFVTNALDNCTQIINDNVLLQNYQGGVTPAKLPQSKVLAGTSGTSTFSSGVGRLTLRRPDAPITGRGSVDVCVDLGTDVPEVCQATSALQAWLQGRWSGTDYDDDPRVRATFGVYKSEFIYLREMY